MSRFARAFLLVLTVFIGLLISSAPAYSQTDIRITGAQAGFPVAAPRLCNAGGGEDYVGEIPELISRDLQISGIFKVLNPATFVETAGKCLSTKEVAYSDWSIIGAEGLVRGEVSVSGKQVIVKMYLHDIQQQRAVLGKRYEADISDVSRVAHRFANEIVRHFTGEKGVFGTRIVYVSRVGRFKELFIMDLDGSNVRQLTRDKGLAISPSWSPSGSRLVYTSYRSRRPELYFISPEGGSPRRLTKRPGLELGAEFSPDGTTLVTAASVSGISKIALFDLRGRMLKLLTSSGGIDVSPTWSPDGSRIAFCSNRAGGPQIYIMSSSGGRPKRISFTGSKYCTSPSWSPRGDKIVFTCRKRGNQIYIVSPEGGEAAQVTFVGNNEDPSWSPDGRFIVFSSNLGRGGPRSIVILSLLGGSPTQISFAKSEDSQPVWSPMFD